MSIFYVSRRLVSDEYEDARLVSVFDDGPACLAHTGKVKAPTPAAVVEPGINEAVFHRFVNADDFVPDSKGEGEYPPFPITVVAAKQDGALIFLKKRGENFRVFVNEAAAKFSFRQGKAFERFEKKITKVLVKSFCK